MCVSYIWQGVVPLSKTLFPRKAQRFCDTATRQLKHIVTHPHSVDQTQRIAHQNLPFPLKGAYPQPDFLPWSLVKSVLCALAASAWLALLRLRTYSWSMCHHRQRQDFQQRMTDSSSTTCGVIILFCGLFFESRGYRYNAWRTSVFLPTRQITFTGHSSFLLNLTLALGFGKEGCGILVVC